MFSPSSAGSTRDYDKEAIRRCGGLGGSVSADDASVYWMLSATGQLLLTLQRSTAAAATQRRLLTSVFNPRSMETERVKDECRRGGDGDGGEDDEQGTGTESQPSLSKQDRGPESNDRALSPDKVEPLRQTKKNASAPLKFGIDMILSNEDDVKTTSIDVTSHDSRDTRLSSTVRRTLLPSSPSPADSNRCSQEGRYSPNLLRPAFLSTTSSTGTTPAVLISPSAAQSPQPRLGFPFNLISPHLPHSGGSHRVLSHHGGLRPPAPHPGVCASSPSCSSFSTTFMQAPHISSELGLIPPRERNGTQPAGFPVHHAYNNHQQHQQVSSAYHLQQTNNRLLYSNFINSAGGGCPVYHMLGGVGGMAGAGGGVLGRDIVSPLSHHGSGGHGGNAGGHQSKKKRSWSRAVFSNLQRKGLEKRFDVQKYVTKPDRRQLAGMLGLTDAQVKVWFQNRRMKWRHQEEAAKKKKEDDAKRQQQQQMQQQQQQQQQKRDQQIVLPISGVISVKQYHTASCGIPVVGTTRPELALSASPLPSNRAALYETSQRDEVLSLASCDEDDDERHDMNVDDDNSLDVTNTGHDVDSSVSDDDDADELGRNTPTGCSGGMSRDADEIRRDKEEADAQRNIRPGVLSGMSPFRRRDGPCVLSSPSCVVTGSRDSISQTTANCGPAAGSIVSVADILDLRYTGVIS